MNKKIETLNQDDVISVFKHDEGKFTSGDTLKVMQLLREYEDYIKAQNKNNNHEICVSGIECEVLKQNGEYKGWRKGKIKFVIQFEPDEVSNKQSNSLDDIRHQINE